VLYRRNRALTALEIESEENHARGVGIFATGPSPTQAGFAPARPYGRSSFDECVYEVSACSLPPRINSGEKQTGVIPENAGNTRVHMFDDSGPLEPPWCSAFAMPQRSFSHPFFRRERGYRGGGSNLIFTARKRIPGENRTGCLTCSTVELPPRDVGEDRIRTDNHARMRRSNPDLTAWKIGASCRTCAGLAALQGLRVALYA
jgi:hypothetical protein